MYILVFIIITGITGIVIIEVRKRRNTMKEKSFTLYFSSLWYYYLNVEAFGEVIDTTSTK